MSLYRFDLKCPECNAPNNAATSFEDSERPPAKGDLTFCAHCSSLLEIVDDNEARAITSAEFKELPEDLQKEVIRLKDLLP